MMRRAVLALAALLIAADAPTGDRYGDHLLAAASRRAGGMPLRLVSQGKDGVPIVLGAPIAGGADVPLHDAMGTSIGTVTVPAARRRSGARIAAWLARRIYVVGNLAEPDPFVPGAHRSAAAQAYVEDSLTRFPDLVTLALHVAPVGGANTIIASSFGRIGKAGDADDLNVERSGAVLREVTNGGLRLAVELPLLDRSGRAIGALSTSFAVPRGTDPQNLYPRALAVRAALARRIASRASLFGG